MEVDHFPLFSEHLSYGLLARHFHLQGPLSLPVSSAWNDLPQIVTCVVLTTSSPWFSCHLREAYPGYLIWNCLPPLSALFLILCPIFVLSSYLQLINKWSMVYCFSSSLIMQSWGQRVFVLCVNLLAQSLEECWTHDRSQANWKAWGIKVWLEWVWWQWWEGRWVCRGQTALLRIPAVKGAGTRGHSWRGTR